MDIVIDGYNLLGSRGGLWGDVKTKREALIAELSRYARARGHAVTVVFDGADTGVTDRSLPVSGVRVVFSRGERADDVVVRLSAQLRERGTVVSSDRAVRDQCRSHGAVVLGVKEFEERLEKALGGFGRARTGGSADGDHDAEDEAGAAARPSGEKRGNPFRRSKAERHKRRRLDRL